MSLDYYVLPASFALESADFASFLQTRCKLIVPNVVARSSRWPRLEELHEALRCLHAELDENGAVVARNAQGAVETGAFVEYDLDGNKGLTRLSLSKGPLPFLLSLVERLAYSCGPFVVLASDGNAAALIVPGIDAAQKAEVLRGSQQTAD